MGSEESETELDDLKIEGVGMSLNQVNPYSPRQLRFRMDTDPSFGYKRLRLTGEELKKPPSTIWKLKELEFLDMSPGSHCDNCLDFQLERLPRDVSKLVNLRVLSLDTNKLEEIPAEVGLLYNLERLVLSNNLLTDLPRSLKGLDKLCSLHLANNYMEEIPKVVYSLTNLKFLDVCDNKLTHLAPEIEQLTNLESLLLMCNQLESIPDTIGECLSLKTLWLAMNRITELPRSIGQLFDLDWAKTSASANLDENPLKEPPLEICKRGPLVIEEYFRNKEMMVMIMTKYNLPRLNDRDDSDSVLQDVPIALPPSRSDTKYGDMKNGFLPDAINSRSSTSTSSTKGFPVARNNAWGSPSVSPESSSYGSNSRKSRDKFKLPKVPSRAYSVPASVFLNSTSPSLKSEPGSARSHKLQQIVVSRNEDKTPQPADPRNSAPVSKHSRLPNIASDGLRSRLSERPRSKYSDFVKQKAWERWEQLTKTLPMTADARHIRLPSTYHDLSSSATSELLKIMKTATPQYDFSFSNTRDIQILRLYESPKNKETSGTLFTKSPRAPNIPKSEAKPRRSTKPNSARSLNTTENYNDDENERNNVQEHEETNEDVLEEPDPEPDSGKELSDSDELEIPSTADLVSRLERLRQDQEMQRRFRIDRKSAGKKTKLTSKKKPSKSHTMDDRLPMIMINSKENSPQPNTPDQIRTQSQTRVESQNADEASTRPSRIESRNADEASTRPSPSPIATPAPQTAVSALPPPRRRGYVVEKRTLMRGMRKKHKKRKLGRVGGKLYKTKQATLGATMNAAERADTELTLYGQGEDSGDEEDAEEENEEDAENEDENEDEKENEEVGRKEEGNEDDIIEAGVKKKVKGSQRVSRKLPSRTGSVKRTKKALEGVDGMSLATKNTPSNNDNRRSPIKPISRRSTPYTSRSVQTGPGPKIAFGKIVPQSNEGPSKRTRRSGRASLGSSLSRASLGSPLKSLAQDNQNRPISSSQNVSRIDQNSPSKSVSIPPSRIGIKSRTNTPIKGDFWSIYRKDPNVSSASPTGSISPKKSPAFGKAKRDQLCCEHISNKGQMIRSDSQTSTQSESSDKVVKKRRRSSRKRNPKSPVEINNMDEFQAARDLFGPVLCRDCELKHLVQAYKDSIEDPIPVPIRYSVNGSSA